jgi:glyoxylase-like metal-dependent hydrolase (beta-lactamase superfamily II)
MKVETIVSGRLLNNTYLITDEKTGEYAVIDPGENNRELFSTLQHMEKGKLKYIIATHGHYDHVTDMPAVKEAFGGQTVIHKADAPMLHDRRNLGNRAKWEPDILLSGGERLMLGDTVLTIINTPGHTKGGICIRCGSFLFTGDTLFHDDVGRTDIPGGSEEELRHSIKTVLGAIEEDLTVLPGHEESSTLLYEKINNLFFK